MRRELEFRDPALGRRLGERLAELLGEIGRSPVAVMHVCGSHEQAIARYGWEAASAPSLPPTARAASSSSATA